MTTGDVVGAVYAFACLTVGAWTIGRRVGDWAARAVRRLFE